MASLIVWLWVEFTRQQRDLLNRLMARNYGEYAMTVPTVHKPLKRFSRTDEIEAEIEQRRKLEKEAARHA